jgi:hypothetical protein
MWHKFAALVAAAAAAGIAGCGSPGTEPAAVAPVQPFVTERTAQPRNGDDPTPEQAAVQKLLAANKAAFDGQFAKLTAEATPADVTKGFAAYTDEMTAYDASGCPLAFRGAWARHLKDWKALTKAVGFLPNAYEGVEFMDMLNGLFASGSDRGKPLGADVATGVKAVKKSLGEVHSAAERMGLELLK